MKKCNECNTDLVSITGLADMEVHDLDKHKNDDVIENIYVVGKYCPKCNQVKAVELGS